MEALDPTAAGAGVKYDPAAARAFFESAGTVEVAADGATLFAESEKGSRWLLQWDKMYYLLEGEIALSVGGKVIDTLRAGEVFGEMAPLGDFPRSATAVARSACRLLALDEKQFKKAMHAQPGFALMMLNMMIARLRLTIAALAVRGGLSDDQRWSEGRVFDKRLSCALGDPVPVAHPRHKVILTEGTVGAFVYVVIQGTVALSIQSKIVEKIGPGGVFGELALVDQGPRAATAVAETDCELLVIGRKDFLELAGNKPDFGLALLKAFAERLRHMDSYFR
jgi:CRP/FNR family transcriptional regulator, cyclic AMP receptor protein